MTFLSSCLCTNKCHLKSIFGRNIQGEKLSCCPRGAGSRAYQSACLSISGSLAFLKVVGSCQSAHPKLFLNQKEKDAELRSMTRNSQRMQEPERPHEVLALKRRPGPAARDLLVEASLPPLSSPKLRPWKHDGAIQPGLASCRRKVSRCCHRGSRGEAFREGGMAIK